VPAPENLTIDTPEQIALEFPLAGVGSRFLAVAFDTLLQAVAAAILIGILLLARLAGVTGSSAAWIIAALLLLWFVVYAGYFAVFESIWTGQTPGKRLVGVRVIDVSGRPVSAYSAIIRNVLRIVDQLPGVYAVGILSVLVTGRQQRLGDLAAGTVVVHERVEALSRPPAPRANTSVRLGAQALTPADILLIEGFLNRRNDLDPWIRLQTARKIAGRMAEKLRLEGVEHEEPLLEQLAAEYRGR